VTARVRANADRRMDSLMGHRFDRDAWKLTIGPVPGAASFAVMGLAQTHCQPWRPGKIVRLTF